MKLALELIGSNMKSVVHDHEWHRDDTDYNQLLDAVETAITVTRKWVTEKYVVKGKLSNTELEAFMGAIRMYVLDSADGEPESHFYYLRQHLSGLSYERFRVDYRNTYDYILRQYFTNARALLVSLGYETNG
jgi:hypothetical protein